MFKLVETKNNTSDNNWLTDESIVSKYALKKKLDIL